MKRTLLLLFAFTLFLSGSVFAFVNGEYRSKANGNWNTGATWEVYNSTTLTWSAAITTNFPNLATAVATVQAGHTITMGGAAQVKTLKLDGIVKTSSSSLLTIADLGSIAAGPTAYIDGPLAYNMTIVTAQANSPRTLNIPLAKNGIVRPVVFKVAQTRASTISYVIEMFNSAPASITLPATLASVSNRYYTISRNASPALSNVILSLSYDSDETIGTYNTNLRVVKDNGTAWVDQGGVGTASITGKIT